MKQKFHFWKNPCAHRLAGGISLCTLIVWIFYPLWIHPGWPNNHEWTIAFQQPEMIKRGFQSGQWLPLWAPDAQYSYGSPVLLFYHKLFYTLAAVLALFTGSYWAIKILVPAFLLIGALGMRRMLSNAQIRPLFSWLGATLFVIAPYTFTQWLTRGSMAEFSAMMVAPWFLAELVLFLSGVRRYRWLTFYSLLLFLGHVMIAYYGFLLAGAQIAVLILSRKLPLKTLKLEWKEIALCLGVFLLITAPLVAGVQLVMPYFTADILKQYQFHPSSSVQPLHLYFAHNSFKWGKKWDGYSVEINRFVLIGILACTILLYLKRIKARDSTVVFFALAFTFLVFLQTRAAMIFYDTFPGAAYLQFGFRLLSYLTPISIFLFFILSEKILASRKIPRSFIYSGAVAVPILTFTFFAYPSTRYLMGFQSQEGVELNIQHTPGAGSFEEYMPRGICASDVPYPAPFLSFNEGCQLENPPSDFKNKELVIKNSSSTSCTVVVRQFQSPLLSVELHNGAEVLEPTRYGAIQVKLPVASSAVTIRPRGLLELIVSEASKRIRQGAPPLSPLFKCKLPDKTF